MTWASELIGRSLLTIQTQWIYRNDIVHKRAKDGLKITESTITNNQIIDELDLRTKTLLGKDKYLLNHSRRNKSE